MESFYTVKWQGGYVLPLNYMGHVEKKKCNFLFPSTSQMTVTSWLGKEKHIMTKGKNKLQSSLELVN